MQRCEIRSVSCSFYREKVIFEVKFVYFCPFHLQHISRNHTQMTLDLTHPICRRTALVVKHYIPAIFRHYYRLLAHQNKVPRNVFPELGGRYVLWEMAVGRLTAVGTDLKHGPNILRSMCPVVLDPPMLAVVVRLQPSKGSGRWRCHESELAFVDGGK